MVNGTGTSELLNLSRETERAPLLYKLSVNTYPKIAAQFVHIVSR